MPSMMSILEDYCKTRNIKYIIHNNDIHFIVKGKLPHAINFFVMEDIEQISLLSELVEEIPKSKMPILGEFLIRINNPMIIPIGYYEMNMDECYVRLLITNMLNGVTLNEKIIDDMISIANYVLDVTYMGFIAILEDEKTAIEAYNIVEKEAENMK